MTSQHRIYLFMWFKNLLIYRFTKPFNYTVDELNQKLAEKAFRPCTSQEYSSFGWVSPIGGEGMEYSHTAGAYTMICAKRQDRILPAAVINEVLADKVTEIKEQEGRSPRRKERGDLKDEIIFELLPRAFTRSTTLYAYIAPSDGLLVINSASHNRAEELLSYLRETLGSLPVLPVKAKNLAQHAMTQWVKSSSAPTGFELGGECELRDGADESAVIRCKNQNLAADEIISHVNAGMVATKLALNWSGGIDCIVDDQLTIKRLSFADLIQEKAEQVDSDSAAEQFDVDFTIMTGEFAAFIPAILNAFGGEDLSDCEAQA